MGQLATAAVLRRRDEPFAIEQIELPDPAPGVVLAVGSLTPGVAAAYQAAGRCGPGWPAGSSHAAGADRGRAPHVGVTIVWSSRSHDQGSAHIDLSAWYSSVQFLMAHPALHRLSMIQAATASTGTTAGDGVVIAWRPGSSTPASSNSTMPLQSRLQPCSGCDTTTWAASRSTASAAGQVG